MNLKESPLLVGVALYVALVSAVIIMAILFIGAEAHAGESAPCMQVMSEPAFSEDVERWRGIVAIFFKPSDIDQALRIIQCESQGDPLAKNPNSSATGLWQHLARYWGIRSNLAGIKGADINDPVASTIVAAYLRYETSPGWHHWTCY